MDNLQVEIAGQRTAFAPGEEVEVQMQWNLDTPAEAVELRLVWNTTGRGTSDLAVVNTIRFDTPQQSESRRERLRLPDSPYSFAGKLISLVWALELVALPDGASARQEITIAPVGKKTDITRDAAETAD
jgi:hypothetical protein